MSPSQDQIYQVISQRYKTLEESDTVTQTLRHQLQCTIVLLNQINYKTSRPDRKILKDPFTGLLAIMLYKISPQHISCCCLRYSDYHDYWDCGTSSMIKRDTEFQPV